MSPSACPTHTTIAHAIDHTLLTWESEITPEALADRHTQYVNDAVAWQCAGVCVRPQWVAHCKTALDEALVKFPNARRPFLACVIAFPPTTQSYANELSAPTFGDVPLASSVAEIRQAISDGATELDAVLPVSLWLTDWAALAPQWASLSLEGQLKALLQTQTAKHLGQWKAAAGKTPIKLIVETDLQPPEAIEALVGLTMVCDLATIKTSSGMLTAPSEAPQQPQGAVIETIARMVKAIAAYLPEFENPIGIKASGGIRSAEQAQALLTAGATRLGTSRTQALIEGQALTTPGY